MSSGPDFYWPKVHGKIFKNIDRIWLVRTFSGPAKNLKPQSVDPCYESTLPRPTNHNNIYIESSRTSASGSSDGIETSADVFNLNVFLIKDYFHIFLLPILKYLRVMDHYHQFHKVLLRFGPNPYWIDN